MKPLKFKQRCYEIAQCLDEMTPNEMLDAMGKLSQAMSEIETERARSKADIRSLPIVKKRLADALAGIIVACFSLMYHYEISERDLKTSVKKKLER